MGRTLFAGCLFLVSLLVAGCWAGPDDDLNNRRDDAGVDGGCPAGQELDPFSGECEPRSCRDSDECTLGFYCEQGQCVEGPRSCESSQASSYVGGCRGEWLNCDTAFGKEDFQFICTEESDRWVCDCNRDNIPEGEPESFNDQCAEVENIHEKANQLCDWAMPKVDAVN